MKNKRKTLVGLSLAGLLLFSAGCTGNGNGGNKTNSLDPKDYVSAQKFITMADLPPNPFDSLEEYASLGFSGYILTQDYCDFTENGKITEKYKEAIKNAGKAGLDVYIRNHYNDPDYFVNEDDTTKRDKYNAGESIGNYYTIPKRNVTTEFGKMPEVKGFYMADEPVYDNIKDYGKLIEWYNTYYSETSYFHMNLLPSYATPKMLSYHNYGEYVEEFIDKIVKNVKGRKSVCLDNYPFTEQQPNEIRYSYLSDLLLVAQANKAYNEAAAAGDEGVYGICVQTFSNPTQTDISSKEMVFFQLVTGMAMGAKLFEYFAYNSAPSVGIYGIMNDGEKRIYEHVKAANDAYLGFYEVLNAFEWQGVKTFSAADETNSENAEAFEAVSDITIRNTGVLDAGKSSARLDAIAGCFKKGDRDGYMFVNYSVPMRGRSNTLTLRFTGCSEALVYTGGANGMKAEKVKLADGTLRLNLGAGEGAFVIPA